MSHLQKFAFDPLDVRVVELEGSPRFVAADVHHSLGMAQAGTNFSFLSADEIRPLARGLTSTKGMGTAKNLTESGVYKLVMRSDKPAARAFQDWGTQVVLPAIRKDGAYVLGEEKVATGEMREDELVMQAMNIMSRKVDRLTQERDIPTKKRERGSSPPRGCLEVEHQLRPRWTAVMLTHALPLPVTSTTVRADMYGPEVLRCATPNTSSFHISHG
ncbi:BRO family protein [Pseudomonas extremaustralis]|uniref:BRO-N domain-containing protein n=1 Tax=Pseudomonas extremaustralis TaxID=359110 RepID=UPI00285B922B|nr:BRO family protein [Pseudomonas extremaustralis]MDR6578212.1 prophage antirepressor-like protein [Pseudomonas extremaustralis]